MIRSRRIQTPATFRRMPGATPIGWTTTSRPTSTTTTTLVRVGTRRATGRRRRRGSRAPRPAGRCPRRHPTSCRVGRSRAEGLPEAPPTSSQAVRRRRAGCRRPTRRRSGTTHPRARPMSRNSRRPRRRARRLHRVRPHPRVARGPTSSTSADRRRDRTGSDRAGTRPIRRSRPGWACRRSRVSREWLPRSRSRRSPCSSCRPCWVSAQATRPALRQRPPRDRRNPSPRHPRPAPTPIIYTIKKGDFLNKVAAAHGITLEELLAANPDIKDPNKIVEGQRITIPAPSQAPPEEFGSAAPSSEASP